MPSLAPLLATTAPPGLTSIVLHASGEAALSAAIDAARTATHRREVATLEHAATPVPDARRASSPYCYRCPLGLTFPACDIACLDSLAAILAGDAIAAVVVEPGAEVAGGMIAAPPGHLRKIRALCDASGALLIADERATGAGLAGFFWAFTRDGIEPDLIVAGDTLTGGTHAIGATFSSPAVPVPDGEPDPAAVLAASEHLTRIQSGNFLGEARRKASNFSDGLATLAGHPRIGNVRVRGLLAGIELGAGPGAEEPDATAVAAKIPHARAVRNVVVIAPPLDVDDAVVASIPRDILAALR